MKKIKFSVGVLAFMGLAVLNFTQSESSFLSKAMASSSSTSGSSSSGSPSSSSSSSNPCCHWYDIFDNCNQKKTVEENVLVDCKITTTIYESESGECQTEIISFGKITAAVSPSFKASSHIKSTTTQGYEFHSDVVTCPTNGECNDCEEYRPDCKAD